MAAADCGVIETATAVAECAAVVVHYRGSDDTLRAVASLRRQRPAPQPIVVVDNASPDDSWPSIAAALHDAPDVLLLRAQHNRGFGGGCNLAFDALLAREHAPAHVLLLNPDAELSDGGLAAMLTTARSAANPGVVGCRIDDGEGRPWFQHGRFPSWTLSGFHCAAPAAHGAHPAEFVTGACMLLDARLLRDGLRFDERFFLYCEDVDLCREVAARGRALAVTQDAHCTHIGGQSQPGRRVLDDFTAERLFWLTRAKVLLAYKRLAWPQRLVFWATALLAKPVLGLARARSPAVLGPYLRGLYRGFVDRRRRNGDGPEPTTHAATARSRS